MPIRGARVPLPRRRATASAAELLSFGCLVGVPNDCRREMVTVYLLCMLRRFWREQWSTLIKDRKND